MKLFYAPGACSHAPHILLRESGLDFTIEKVDLAEKKTETGADFKKINPHGYVPALQLKDGTVLTEGPAIDQYIADLVPTKKLAPAAGTPERYQLQSWLNFISTELHKPLAMRFYPDLAASSEALKAQVTKRLNWLSMQLTGPHLMGDRFSVADAYLFVCLNWTQFQKFDLSPWPVLIDFMRRVAARPAVQAALAAEGSVPRDNGGFYFTLAQAAE